MNQADQVAMRPPRDNRWKTSYEPGSFLIEVAERAAEAVGHFDLEEEELVQWENQAGNGPEENHTFRSGDLVKFFPIGRFGVCGELWCGLMAG